MWKWFEDIIDKISEYLPDEDALTEEEKAYEEGKARVFALHQSGAALFYVEEAWQDRDGRGKIYGETAKGEFSAGEQVRLLDKYAEFLMEAAIRSMERDEEDQNQDEDSVAAKIYMNFSEEEIKGKEDIFARAFFVVKKYDDKL